MEPITLCGGVALMFGLWVEFEPGLTAVFKKICRNRIIAEMISAPPARKPVYMRRMPICLAKG